MPARVTDDGSGGPRCGRRRLRRFASDDEEADCQAVLFTAAIGRSTCAALEAALVRGAEPSRVALGSCVCGLPEVECVCLGFSPLHCACQAGATKVVRALLSALADPEVKSGRILFAMSDGDAVAMDGLAPLHVAAACGHVRVAELLLSSHADPLAGAVEPRKTAVGFALAAGHQELAEVLRSAAVERMQGLAAAEPRRPVGAEVFLARQALGAPGDTLVSTSKMDALRQRLRRREAEAAASAPVA